MAARDRLGDGDCYCELRVMSAVLHEGRLSAAAPASSPTIRSDFWQIDDGTFGGWAFDPLEPEHKLAVEIILDGVPHKLLRADLFVPELRDAEGTDGCHGFAVALPAAALAHTRQVSAYLANRDVHLGTVHLGSAVREARAWHPNAAGAVRWLGGLRLAGWVRDRRRPALRPAHAWRREPPS